MRRTTRRVGHGRTPPQRHARLPGDGRAPARGAPRPGSQPARRSPTALASRPSLISQIETGRANPSVSTLYAIAGELDVSLDELLFNDRRPAEAAPAPPAQAAATSGTMAPGAAGPAGGRPARDPPRLGRPLGAPDHAVGAGRRVPPRDLRGRRRVEPARTRSSATRARVGLRPERPLQVRIGFDEYVLEPGDAISINSSIPHRLATIGDVPVEAIWFVLGRAQFDAQTLIAEHRMQPLEAGRSRSAS